MLFFVQVILLSLAKTFTYSISEDEYHYIKGMRLAVPLVSKVYCISSETHQNQPTLYDLKKFIKFLMKPIVTEVQIAHWQWIASYYMCAIGDVYRGAMPSALLLESETLFLKNRCFLLMKAHFLMMSF
jgi:primosomal protein N' (replication factor Y)